MSESFSNHESTDAAASATHHVLALRHATFARASHAQLVRSRYNVRRKRTPLTEL
jgi:hypothetical protein